MNKKEITVAEAGRLGGIAVKKKYGAEYYQRIGKLGGEATKESQGHNPEYYSKMGKKGGRKGGLATRDKYGPEYYTKIGSLGGKKVKELMELGKKALDNKT